MSLQLRPYQELGRDFLRGSEGGAGLFLDMGLGKTATTLSALEDRHLPALVLAPKKVAEEVWEDETALWRPDLRIRLAVGEPAQRAAALADESADIIVISRDNQGDVVDLKRRPFRTLIIDELSGYKSRGSVRWKTAKKIITQYGIKHRWGLTGTPTPNGLMDLWSQLYLLDGGQRLGKTLTGFQDRYFYPVRIMPPHGIVTEWGLKEHAEERIWERISDICLAMETDGRVELPERTFNELEFDLSPKVRKVYNRMRNDLVADLRLIFGSGDIHTANNAAVLTSKLAQITAGFIFSDEAAINGKWSELHRDRVSLIKETLDVQTSPTLLFYRFRPERQMLLETLGKGVHTIDEKGVVKAWNRGDVPILLAHPQSAGHGLNLQHGGHTALWSSPTWDLEEWDQGNKRLFRSGQKHPVVVHSVLARNSIDHLTYARLAHKAITQDSLLAHLESPI